MSWLSHKALQIVKGIGKTPGDPYSAENDPVVVNLMSGAITISGDDGWTPNIPSTKNGGIWADSPLSDGRRLLAAAAGNVTENITVIVTDGSYLGAMKALDSINKMAIDCRDFWQTDYQIDPVYLKWWAGCGAGFQYALISNIEVSPEYMDAPNPTMRVSLAIEREPYWRGIPPGANPKVWTYEVNLSKPQFGYNVANLVALSDHLITQTIYNKFEWSPTAYGLQQTFITRNYIDIPETAIPGDAPALVELSITPSWNNNTTTRIFVGRSSKKFTNTGHDGVSRAAALILNAGDGNAAGVATKTLAGSDTGVFSNGSSVNPYRGVRTVTGVDGSYVTAVQWGGTAAANSVQLDRQVYRGTFAIFARAYNNSAVTPVLTDMKMRVTIDEYDNSNPSGYNTITLPEVNVPIYVTNQDYDLTYMGTVSLPFEDRSVVSALGYGLQIAEDSSNLRVSLEQQVVVATANRTFTALDLIFMPIDEGLVSINNTNNSGGTNNYSILLDNTGYMTRGEQRQVSYIYSQKDSGVYIESGGIGQEVRGDDLTLRPKVAQRLYIIGSYVNGSGGSNPQSLQNAITARLNIVPRWAGIRDV